ncbi:metallophosphoesterase [Antarcticibacterium flavum]|uniref:Metallophosphoesterase n=1 Tax=Antarcticibacterium flavum TaxID=2058175 RepID=A0A5B7X451_9FLAO|nr:MULTISPECIES: metallophosphatase domain-containing protein [Antarcticibacterium]MCM4158335.1 metallophosphoesterase [Antarcticibacterium sp. W02-3]QCY70099.1 metallophosphoesterase [Antarcticibacterium flavum]
MKVICIADTHNKQEDIIVPPGDVIIHAGDFSEAGTKKETQEFLEWFASLPHKHKLLVPGNHDFYLEKHLTSLDKIIPAGIHCLINTGLVINNVKFWGSPFTPGDSNWAFTKPRGREMRECWDLIPEDVELLITHTPPYGILDQLDNKKHLGCEQLTSRLKEVKPSYHIFGHIHHEYGIVKIKETVFVNAALLDDRYRLINSPLTIHHFPS